MAACLLRILRWLRELGISEAELAYARELERRPKLDDDAFYEEFYASTGIQKAIPVRLRRLYEKIIGDDLSALQPQDNYAAIHEDLDFADVLYRVGREFHLKIPLATVLKAPLKYKGTSSDPGEIDGTFDSVVRFLAKTLRDRTIIDKATLVEPKQYWLR